MDVKPMNVRRVFLLGAGASKGCGLPLTNELFPLALRQVRDTKVTKLITDFIKYQYPYFRTRWKNYPRFEEFLSLVDVYLDFADVIKTTHSFSHEQVGRIKKELLLAASEVLHGASDKAARSKTMTSLAKMLGPGDVVITFNWDLLLEQALHDLKRDWEYSHGGHICILKPHGSLDWFDSKEVQIKTDLTFPLNEKFGRIRVFKRFRAPKISRPVVPVILPPVINKKIEFKELEVIWRDAWKALRHTGEIHILGYSLPPEDLIARFTIRSAIRANERFGGRELRISVVNPDRNVYLRFARLVQVNVSYYESGVEGVSLTELVTG